MNLELGTHSLSASAAKMEKIVFEAIAELMTPPEEPRRKIGFEVKEKPGGYRKKATRKKG